MNLDYAEAQAREHIKALAKDSKEEIALLRGMLIMIDAIKGEL